VAVYHHYFFTTRESCVLLLRARSLRVLLGRSLVFFPSNFSSRTSKALKPVEPLNKCTAGPTTSFQWRWKLFAPWVPELRSSWRKSEGVRLRWRLTLEKPLFFSNACPSPSSDSMRPAYRDTFQMSESVPWPFQTCFISVLIFTAVGNRVPWALKNK